ncbi:MAG: mechanosensitive ion channel [Bdellovibrionales bacterium]
MDQLLFTLRTVWDIFLKFWQFRLYEVDGNPITLGTLFIGIFLLFVGYLWARRLSQQITNKVLTRFEIDESIRASLSQVIFYVLLIIFTLFILHLLNIPVTVFTVLGGALAIGVGFGSQNIVNNFISGLVLMVERPIRVGDVIDVGTLQGTVEEIGTRSTKVKSFDNTHVVVPNSSFLEKNVLNWTLSDNVVRNKVIVGVAYGSPARKVEELLLEVAESNEHILRHPKPAVIFSDFGDSALIFELYYYARLRTMIELKKIASEIRFSIDDCFRQSGVVISFPQRDVYLDITHPGHQNAVFRSVLDLCYFSAVWPVSSLFYFQCRCPAVP